METLGAKLVSAEIGCVNIELPFSENLCQQQGFLHAGVVATLADNVCGYAALTEAPDGTDVVTAEFKINFLHVIRNNPFFNQKSEINIFKHLYLPPISPSPNINSV